MLQSSYLVVKTVGLGCGCVSVVPRACVREYTRIHHLDRDLSSPLDEGPVVRDLP